MPLLMENFPFDADKSEVKVTYKFLGFLCEKCSILFLIISINRRKYI